MDTTCNWIEKVYFEAKFGAQTVAMDTRSPVGSDRAASPKQLVLAAICGCSGMDVAMFFRKARVTPTAFAIEAHADMVGSRPAVFKNVHLRYKISGDIPPATIVEAVQTSMTLDCGVSAMIAKACPITYEIEKDGAKIGDGAANFAI